LPIQTPLMTIGSLRIRAVGSRVGSFGCVDSSTGQRLILLGFFMTTLFSKCWPTLGAPRRMGYIGAAIPAYTYPPPVHSLGRRLRYGVGELPAWAIFRRPGVIVADGRLRIQARP
jgi:hypothetical protein